MDARFKEMLKEVSSESDRSSALIHVANLDNQLRRMLENHTVAVSKKLNKQVFESTGFLSTLSAKIHAAYLFGLITENEFHDFNVIRKIRNFFAHEEFGLFFSSDKIVNLCDALVLASEAQADRPEFNWRGSRHSFELVSMSLYYILLDRSNKLLEDKLVSPANIPIFPKR